MAGTQDPDNLNMLLGTETIDTDLSIFWAGYLFILNDRGELEPELASRVPSLQNGDISPDGLRVTYRLRHGVTWQDGKPFDARDVAFTWRAMLDPRNTVVSRFGYDVVSRLEAPDRYTVVAHLRRRFAPFVNTFFTLANHADCILPEHLLARLPSIDRAAYNDRPVGTGPFRVARYEKGSEIVFEANPHYWRGRPKLDRIDYHLIASDHTILTMMQSHQLDFFHNAPSNMAPSLRGIPGTRVSLTPFSTFTDLGINAGNPILEDLRVRQAIAYGTDRNALVNKVTHDIAVTGDTDQPPFSWANDPSARRYGYDPRRAAALLDAAGWKSAPNGIREKDGHALSLVLVGITGSATVAAIEELLQAQWRQIGVDVSIKNFPPGELYATQSAGGIEQSGKFDLVVEEWAGGTDPDDSILLRCTMAPPAGWNIYHFCNRSLDAAEDVALSSYDRAVRKSAYARVQELANEGLPFLILFYEREFDVINTDLRNYRPSHAVTPFWNTWDWSM